METNHTPGPWSMKPVMAGYFVNGYIIAGEENVARTITMDEGYDEANALLITAAPDLLEACLLARHICEEGSALQQQLDAAIAKATGKE